MRTGRILFKNRDTTSTKHALLLTANTTKTSSIIVANKTATDKPIRLFPLLQHYYSEWKRNTTATMADNTKSQADESLRSPRLHLWIAFFLFSLITMGSAIDAVRFVYSICTSCLFGKLSFIIKNLIMIFTNVLLGFFILPCISLTLLGGLWPVPYFCSKVGYCWIHSNFHKYISHCSHAYGS